MATNFPGSADDSVTLPNPSGSNNLNSPDHASIHSNANDAIKAIEAKVGTGASTPSNNTFMIGNGSGTSAWSSLTSAQLAARLSDETGTGAAVFANTPTLTTPKADSINEETAANGVTVDGLNIKDGKLNTNDSVVEANYTDGSIKPEHLLASTGTTWVWQAWTPTWTNLTVGNATVSARYVQVGKTIFFRLIVTFGSTTSITGSFPTFSLPAAATSTGTGTVGEATGIYLDNGTAYYYGTLRIMNGATTCELAVTNVGGTYAAEAGISSTVPMTWTTNDRIQACGFYEAA